MNAVYGDSVIILVAVNWVSSPSKKKMCTSIFLNFLYWGYMSFLYARVHIDLKMWTINYPTTSVVDKSLYIVSSLCSLGLAKSK